MSAPLSRRVSLASDRIAAQDAERQRRTAEEILARLGDQPGVVLADEVGMGKTYVALSVAVSVLEATQRRRPVLVLVPPSVQHKWPKEWRTFAETCLASSGPTIRATERTVNTGVELLRLLDDDADRRHHIIFATHGAFARPLTDPWIQLALVRRAFYRRPSLAAQKKAFPTWAEQVLRDRRFDAELVRALLDGHPRTWHAVAAKHGIVLDDDPVPAALLEPIDQLDPRALVAHLADVPLRWSAQIDSRLARVRKGIRDVRDELWRSALGSMNLRLPLLILDEAHHARNPKTKLAELLDDRQGDDAARGALAGAFDRMLFLTATPFQLGHHELIRVLDRFDGVRWPTKAARVHFAAQRKELHSALDRSQLEALRLQQVWQRITPEECAEAGDEWWSHPNDALPDSLRRAAERLAAVRSRFAEVEALLRPWVIRHLKGDREERRDERPGQRMLDPASPARGIGVDGPALLPFLLAARAQALVSRRGGGSDQARALFAEGLASSFEAYRTTRQADDDGVADSPLDVGATGSANQRKTTPSPELDWYLRRIDEALPADGSHGFEQHPKLAATVELAVDLWARREKLLVFCFYVATGRALRAHVSRAVYRRTIDLAATQLGADAHDVGEVERRLTNLSNRFFDADSPATRAAEGALRELFAPSRLGEADREALVDVSKRFLRTPSFLVRYVSLDEDRFADATLASLAPSDDEASLGPRLARFATYLAGRIPSERESILSSLGRLVTGVRPASDPYDSGPRHADDVWVPDVRLANGSTPSDRREDLMQAFNSPFFPDVFIASAVMGEGVDLHLMCRHVVHHDGDWNPSVLEQRTGRVERLGSLAQRTGERVVVYEPYLAGAQDEKQYRVVKDRDRWFNVVMGAPLELDERSTDRVEQRVPLPAAVAESLALRLGVAD